MAAIPPRKDIFGTWLLRRSNRSTSGPQPMMQFADAPRSEGGAAYDPFSDDPTFRCDPVGIRRVWGAPGTPLQIVRDGPRCPAPRVDGRASRRAHEHEGAPEDGPRSSLGPRSVGSTRARLIETANYRSRRT